MRRIHVEYQLEYDSVSMTNVVQSRQYQTVNHDNCLFYQLKGYDLLVRTSFDY
jgi:hypothetical protein